MWSTCLSTTQNREETKARQAEGTVDTLAHLSTAKDLESDSGFLAFRAHSGFLSGWLWIELKFYSLKDLFLKIEGSRIILDQENQFL